MTKSTITRERAEQLANFKGAPVTRQEEQELARIALAAMDSEPVAWTDEEELRDVNVAGIGYLFGIDREANKFADPRRQIMLYRHAQPAPVVPAVSDDIGEIRVGRLPIMNQDDYPGLGDWWVQLRIGKDSDEVLARVYGATPQEANNRAEALACRAAMLQAGNSPAQSDCCPAQNHVSPEQNGDTPAQSQGWIPVSELMPDDNSDVLCTAEFDGPGDWRRKVGYWHEGKWVVYGASWTPTHWMPLPAAPQEVK